MEVAICGLCLRRLAIMVVFHYWNVEKRRKKNTQLVIVIEIDFGVINFRIMLLYL